MKTEFKWGDRVLVKDIDDNVWSERIFLQEIKGSQNPYITVNGYYEPEFLRGEPFRTIAYTQIKPLEKELPTSWDDDFYNDFGEEFTKRVGTLRKLAILRDIYNDGQAIDWTDNETKYIIYFSGNQYMVTKTESIHEFLAFKSEELRDKFLKNFIELIEEAKPLL